MAIGRVNTGGGSAAYAFVIATFPAGSTVSCTNSSGSKDLSATQKLFYLKQDTTSCTVTATKDGKTATKAVTGITEGSSTTVTLTYELVVYNRGTTHYTWTPASALTSDHIHTSVTVTYGTYPESAARNTESIDFTSYKTLKFIATRNRSNYSTAYLRIKSASGSNVYSKAIDVSSTETEYSIDIDGNTLTDGYIQVITNGAGDSGIGGSSYTTDTDVYSIVLQ